jgi:predicted ABC-type ATPase
VPDIFVIGGPNGSGKSTTARELLPDYLGCMEFVNADEIACGLSAFRPETVAWQAGRAMLDRLNQLASETVDFAFETTLASRTFAPWLRQRQLEGYRVHVFYLWLPNPELAVARVALRVQAGGHNVSESDIRRRYERGRRNFFELYAPLANTWELYDNSISEPRLVALGRLGQAAKVLTPQLWHTITGKRYEV